MYLIHSIPISVYHKSPHAIAPGVVLQGLLTPLLPGFTVSTAVEKRMWLCDSGNDTVLYRVDSPQRQSLLTATAIDTID